MTAGPSRPVVIEELPPGKRQRGRHILDDGFSGIYRLHAQFTLRRVPVVRIATFGGEDAGVVLLKWLTGNIGYVYYIAVAGKYRGLGVGGRLLDHAISYFSEKGALEVYAAREEDNSEAKALFESRQFTVMEDAELSGRFGAWQSRRMRREMMKVYGELLLRRTL